MSNIWRLIFMLLAMAAVAVAAGAQQQEAAGTSEPATGKRAESEAATYRVSAGRFRIQVQLKGVLEARKMAELVLRPDAWSKLQVARAVPHGRRVKKGDPLVWLDTRGLDQEIEATEQKLQLSRLSLQQGEAELKLLERSQPLDLEAARRAEQTAKEELKYFLQVRRPRSEKSARFSLQRARFQLEYAQEELKQLEKMYEADDLTEETEEIILKRARRAVEASKFSLEGAEISTERTLRTDLPRQQQSLADTARREQIDLARSRATLPLALRKKRLEVEKLRREQRKTAEQLAKLKKDRRQMIVRAPIDGLVYYGRCVRGKWPDKTKADSQLRRGGMLSANQVFMTVVAPRDLLVRTDLEEKHLGSVRPGVQGIARPTGFPNLALPVRVQRVSPIPVTAGVFDCRMRLEKARGPSPLTPGMTCTVKLTVYDRKNAISVPSKAVFAEEDDEQKRYVYLVQPDGKHRKQPVVVGRETDKKVELVKGLKAGDEILREKPKDDK